MPNLCNQTSCTGCLACVSLCPKDAISVIESATGFLQPEVDTQLCVECKLCEKRCPVLNPIKSDNSDTPTALAAWHNDTSVRMDSSSGGAFSSLADYVLNMGGIVFGAAWSNRNMLTVEHIAVSSTSELHKLRKSKYLQSNIGNTYVQTKKFLRQNKFVLFSGTPCQIAGLYAFLGKKYDNLITVDFVCHGVPSGYVFKKYTKYLEHTYKERIKEINFRDKSLGVECNLLLKVKFESNKIREFKFSKNSFYRGFVSSLYLRDSCYECRFNSLPRIADITMADCRNIGGKVKFEYELDRPYGFTSLLANNDVAMDFIGKTSIKYDRRPFDEVASSQPHLYSPAERRKETSDFYRDIEYNSFGDIAKKYMPMSASSRLAIMLRIILGPKGFYALGRLYKRIKGTRTI